MVVVVEEGAALGFVCTALVVEGNGDPPEVALENGA